VVSAMRQDKLGFVVVREEMELMKTMGHIACYSQMAAFRECWKRHGNVKRTGARDVEGAQTKLG